MSEILKFIGAMMVMGLFMGGLYVFYGIYGIVLLAVGKVGGMMVTGGLMILCLKIVKRFL